MITIDEAPATLACSTCMEPLDWVYRKRDGKWYAIVRVRDIDDPTVVKLHSCTLPGVERTWANLPYQPPEVRRRGIRRARLAAAAATQKLNEKEEHRG